MSSSFHSKILINRRLLAVLALGFSSGLPLSLTGATLQAWFTEAHVDIKAIGALSLLGVPYALKFLWAPLMDHFSFFKWGKRKGWIGFTQLGLIITLLALAEMDPAHAPGSMGIIALLIVFFSSSQDIAINAYTTDVLRPEERGLGAASTVFAYRVAVLVSGGAALVCADYFGWKRTYECMACLMSLSLCASYFAPKTHETTAAASSPYQTARAALLDLWQRDKMWLLLFFIVLYKLGDALALSLFTNFLLHGLSFSLTEVGLAYKTVSFIAAVLGGFIGGALLLRWTLYRALLVFGLAQAFSNLMFAALALVGKQFVLMSAAVFVENFCSGLSTAALLAFMMSLCDHRYTASQFALLSAIASLGRVFLGPLAALMVENLGWFQFFIWSFVLCFPAIFLLTLLKDEVVYHAPAAAD
jgi:PAT family beta-lactamase induction signal transducer AmpG